MQEVIVPINYGIKAMSENLFQTKNKVGLCTPSPLVKRTQPHLQQIKQGHSNYKD
jgi:hypothetical protein